MSTSRDRSRIEGGSEGEEVKTRKQSDRSGMSSQIVGGREVWLFKTSSPVTDIERVL